MFFVKIRLLGRSKWMNVVGPKIKLIRVSKGLTQEALAARCNVLKWDISRGTLAKIESRIRRVTGAEVALLAEALRIDIQELYIDQN
jgi:transcriptional regulator with XRE-family HTH domain